MTNKNVAEIKALVWSKGFRALSNPKVDPLSAAQDGFDFFSACLMLFNETSPMYLSTSNIKINEKLVGLVAEGTGLMIKLRSRKHADVGFEGDVTMLVKVSLQMQYLMTKGMQNLRYLFPSHDPNQHPYTNTPKNP